MIRLIKKRKQHYVWKYYLKPWSLNDKIYCLRNGEIFNPNLEGVANKRDFYRIRELTQEDIKLIEKIAIDNSPEILKEIHYNFIKMFNKIFRLKRWIYSKGLINPQTDKLIDIFINNFEEEIHGKIENNAIKYLDSILKCNLDFYKINHDRSIFLFYVSEQYLRTNKVKSNIVKIFQKNTDVDIEKIWNILRHIFATNTAFNLSEENIKIILIENLSTIPFITGDQPIINTFAVGKKLEDIVENIELYYPISPTLAILLSENIDYSGTEKLIFKEEDVIRYNKYVTLESLEQIYSNSAESLEVYI